MSDFTSVNLHVSRDGAMSWTMTTFSPVEQINTFDLEIVIKGEGK